VLTDAWEALARRAALVLRTMLPTCALLMVPVHTQRGSTQSQCSCLAQEVSARVNLLKLATRVTTIAAMNSYVAGGQHTVMSRAMPSCRCMLINHQPAPSLAAYLPARPICASTRRA
jgi:hypothetical protein